MALRLLEEPKLSETPEAKPNLRFLETSEVSPDEAYFGETTPYTEYIGYPTARVAELVERPLWAATEGIVRMGQKAVDFLSGTVGRNLGIEKKGFFDTMVNYYSQPEKYGLITPYTTEFRERKRRLAYKDSLLKGITADLTESTGEALSLITQMMLLRKMPQVGGTPLATTPLKDLYQHLGRIGVHGLATTPGGLPERTHSAVVRVAYNITPYIANMTGATGMTAVGVDTMLNTFITSPTYMEAYQRAGGLNEEFLATAIPQFVMDVGFAWQTRGLPKNQYNAAMTKYYKERLEALKLPKPEFDRVMTSFKETLASEAGFARIAPEPEKPKIPPKAEVALTPEQKLLELSRRNLINTIDVIEYGRALGRPEVAEATRKQIDRLYAERIGKVTPPKAEVVPEVPPKAPPKVPIEPPPPKRPPTPRELKIEPPLADKIGIREDVLLRKRIRDEVRGAKAGERIGRIETRKEITKQLKSIKAETKEVKQIIIDYARENLTLHDRGKLLSMVAKSTNKKQLARAMQIMDNMEEKYKRKVAITDLKDMIKKSDLKRLRPEYRSEIADLVTDVDLVNRSENTIRSLINTKRYLETHPDNNIPAWKLQELDLLTKKKIKDLTTNDLELLHKSVQHLQKLNDFKNKMIFGRIHREGKEIVNMANENLGKAEIVRRDPNSISTTEKPVAEVSKLKEIFTTESWNTELISEIMDKQEHGIIREVMYKGIDDGTTDRFRFLQEAEDYFKDKVNFDIIKWSEKFHAKPEGNVDYQTIKLPSGKTIKLTKAERWPFILHARNEKNLLHALEGGFAFEKNKYLIHKIDADDLNAIIESATPEERKMADIAHYYWNNIQKARLNERSVELNGWEIATEPDYFPIRTNALDIKRDELKLQKNFSQSTLEGMGILKERTNARNAIILEDGFTTLYKSIKQASAYYGMAKPLRNAKMLLNDKSFQQKVASTYGPHYISNLKNYLKDIEGGSYDVAMIDKLTLDLINRLDIAILGVNPWVMAKQPISLAAASTEIDVKYIKRAKTPVDPDVVRQWSPQLRDRLDGNVTRELGEIGQIGTTRKFFTGRTSISQKFMYGIRNFDYQAIGRIWKAVEFETSALRPELRGDERMKYVAQRAEEVIRKTQPTFLPKDRSSIGRSRSVFIRLITKYTSQRNKNYMMIRRAVEKYNRSGKTLVDKKDMIKRLSIVTIVMPAMLWAIDEIRNRVYKRKEPLRRVRHDILRFLDYNLGNVYFVGNIFRSLSSKIERGTYAGYDISDVLTSSIEQGIDAVADTITAIDQAMTHERYKSGTRKGDLKWRQTAKRAIDRSLSFASRFRGIPYDTIKKLVMAPFKERPTAKPKKVLRLLK